MKRNHKKRHGMNRERSMFDRRAAARAKRAQAEAKAKRARWLRIARLYWSGAAPDIATAARVVDEARCAA